MIYLIFPLTILIFSVFIRINFWPFVQILGTYQGDWWYFYNYYGQYIADNFFFPIEYPVGYVLVQKFAYIISLILGGFSYENWIISNGLIFVPSGLSIFILLEKLSNQINIKSKNFLLYLIISPTFLIASTTNYDLLPVTLTLFAIFLLFKNKIKFSFFILALATVIKLYPAFLLPLFILYQLDKNHVQHIIYSTLIFFITILIINLPFIIYDFNSWVFPYIWQMQNPQRYDFNTISYIFIFFNLDQYRIFLLIGLLSIGWIVSWLYYKNHSLTDKNFLLLTYFIVFTAVLGNHVNTPQYLLWFLPYVAFFQIPSLYIWWPIDLINSSILFSYFKLHSDLNFFLNFVFYFQIASFIFIYFILIYNLKKYYEKN